MRCWIDWYFIVISPMRPPAGLRGHVRLQFPIEHLAALPPLLDVRPI